MEEGAEIFGRGKDIRADLRPQARGTTFLAKAFAALATAGCGLVLDAALASAKAPGVVTCYRNICHRVRTLEEMRAAVGSTVVIETSYYDDARVDRYVRGQWTSSGEFFDPASPARAASAQYPDGTELLLRNPDNGRTAHVRVNDFGPFFGDRLLDVTRKVADDLGFLSRGVAKLEVTVLAPPPAGEPNYRFNRVWPAVPGFLGTYDRAQAGMLIAALAERHKPSMIGPVLAAVPAEVERQVVTTAGSLDRSEGPAAPTESMAPIAPAAKIASLPLPLPAAPQRKEQVKASATKPVPATIAWEADREKDRAMALAALPSSVAAPAEVPKHADQPVPQKPEPKVAATVVALLPPAAAEPAPSRVMLAPVPLPAPISQPVPAPVVAPQRVVSAEPALPLVAQAQAAIAERATDRLRPAPAMPEPAPLYQPEATKPSQPVVVADIAPVQPPRLDNAREATIAVVPVVPKAPAVTEASSSLATFAIPTVAFGLSLLAALTFAGWRRKAVDGAQVADPAVETVIEAVVAQEVAPAPQSPAADIAPIEPPASAVETAAAPPSAVAPAPTPPAPPAPLPTIVPAASVIPAGLVVTGKIISRGAALRIDGIVVGDIEASRVEIGEGGSVEGDIKGGDVTINGRHRGGVESDTLRLGTSGALIGSVVVSTIDISEGAVFEADARIGDRRHRA